MVVWDSGLGVVSRNSMGPKGFWDIGGPKKNPTERRDELLFSSFG